MEPQSRAALLEAVVSLADEQDGAVNHSQLVTLGLRPGAVKSWVRTKRLRTLYPGVYALGYGPVPYRTQLRAGLLSAGDDAVLSHLTAAVEWRIAKFPDFIHITLPTFRRDRQNLRFHEARLAPEDVHVLDGLPVTGLARTIIDETRHRSPYRLERMLDEAYNEHRFDATELLTRLNGVRRAPKLRRALARHGAGIHLTDSDLERRFLAIVHAAKLPAPRSQFEIGFDRPDAVWPELMLVVEVDGPVHVAPGKYQHDREKERRMERAGYRVVRFTWVDILEYPQRVATELAAIMEQCRILMTS